MKLRTKLIGLTLVSTVPFLAAAPLSRGHGLSVDWRNDGGRPVCHIRQAMA